jgi:hypothetical protein
MARIVLFHGPMPLGRLLATTVMLGFLGGDMTAAWGEARSGALAPAGDVKAKPADGPEAPWAPLAAVAVMLDTKQAMLFDETSGKYRLVEVGDVVSGWKVVAIQADLVVVTRGAERDELPIVEPPRPIIGAVKPAATPPPAPPKNEPPAKPTKPVKPATPTTVETGAPATITVKRAELDRELGDFDKLAKTVDFAAAEGGGFTVTRLEKSSWLWRMGLRPGDVVRSVAGQRIASIDDAARVYARLRVVKEFTIEVDRPSDEPGITSRVVLRYEITK